MFKPTLLYAGCMFVTLACFAQTSQRSDETPASPVFTWMTSPKEINTSAVNATTSHARAALFDQPFSKPLDAPSSAKDQSQQTQTAQYIFRLAGNPLPDDLSDVILLGTVVDYQPRLSNDHGMIYTELSVKPQEVIKGSQLTASLNEGVTILQRGGALKLADGRVVRNIPASGSNPIDVGKNYLLFLSYNAAVQAFTVVKAWAVVDNASPVELDANGEEVQHPKQAFDSTTNLIASVKESVEAQQGGKP